MTISQILKKYNNHIEWLDIQALLAHVLNKPREFLITHESIKIPFLKQLKFTYLVHKRKSGIPIAYLTGHKSFYGLDFMVNKHTLVPRPDTEVLVETVLSRITYHVTHNNPVTLVDVGTGSGCIPISIMKTLQPEAGQPLDEEHKNIKTNLDTYAIDISKPALKVAKKNAKNHNTDITFLHGNLLKPILENLKIVNCKLKIIITANLPYLTEEQFATEPSIQHEPKNALVASNNGLALYEELLAQIKLIHDTCYVLRNVSCFLEIDPDQTEEITKMIHTYIPYAEIKIIKDLSGFDRVIEIQT